MPVASKCFHCGYEFESQAITVIDSKNVGLYGNTEQCPRCGWMANIMDGEFDFDNREPSASSLHLNGRDALCCACRARSGRPDDESLGANPFRMSPTISRKL